MRSKPVWGGAGLLFAHEIYQVTPDIMTLAKALGNGVPIGAMLATGEAATGFEPGSHGSTFGGTPLATAAGLKTLALISDPAFLARVREKGRYFKSQLQKLKKPIPVSRMSGGWIAHRHGAGCRGRCRQDPMLQKRVYY